MNVCEICGKPATVLTEWTNAQRQVWQSWRDERHVDTKQADNEQRIT